MSTRMKLHGSTGARMCLQRGALRSTEGLRFFPSAHALSSTLERMRHSAARRMPSVVAVVMDVPPCKRLGGIFDLAEMRRVLCLVRRGAVDAPSRSYEAPPSVPLSSSSALCLQASGRSQLRPRLCRWIAVRTMRGRPFMRRHPSGLSAASSETGPQVDAAAVWPPSGPLAEMSLDSAVTCLASQQRFLLRCGAGTAPSVLGRPRRLKHIQGVPLKHGVVPTFAMQKTRMILIAPG